MRIFFFCVGLWDYVFAENFFCVLVMNYKNSQQKYLRDSWATPRKVSIFDKMNVSIHEYLSLQLTLFMSASKYLCWEFFYIYRKRSHTLFGRDARGRIIAALLPLFVPATDFICVCK